MTLSVYSLCITFWISSLDLTVRLFVMCYHSVVISSMTPFYSDYVLLISLVFVFSLFMFRLSLLSLFIYKALHDIRNAVIVITIKVDINDHVRKSLQGYPVFMVIFDPRTKEEN